MKLSTLLPLLVIIIFASGLMLFVPIEIINQFFLAILVLVVGFVKPVFALYILVFSMLLSPEIVLSGGQGTNRGVTIRVDDLLIGLIGLTWIAKIAILKNIGLFKKTPLNKAIGIYCIVVTLATLMGILMDRVRPAVGFLYVLKYIEYFIIYFMAANIIRTEKDINRFVLAIFITCFITCIVALLQIPADGRVTAPFEGEEGEPNTFGGYLMVLGMLASSLLLNLKIKKYLWLLFPLIGLILVTLLFTLSRSSWMASVPALITLFIYSRKKLALSIILVITIVSAPLVVPQKVTDRLFKTFKKDSLSRKVGGVTLDGSTSERIRDNIAAVEDWMQHPIFGFGVTGYRFLDAQFSRVLVETGILGISSFLWLISSIFYFLKFLIKTSQNQLYKALAIGILSGFIGLITHAISANTFIIVRIMEPFWFLMAIMACILRLENSNAENKDNPATI